MMRTFRSFAVVCLLAAVALAQTKIDNPILKSDPTQDMQAATKHYVDTHGGGRGCLDAAHYSGDFGQQLTAAMAELPTTGGCVDARSISGVQSLSADVTINKPATQVLFGNMTLNQGTHSFIVPVGKHNVALLAAAPYGTTAATTTYGTRFVYTGTGAAVKVGDSTGDTMGFRSADITLDLTGADAAAIGLQLNRVINYSLDRPRVIGMLADNTQKLIDLEGGTNYTGGTVIAPYMSNGGCQLYLGVNANANFIFGGEFPGNGTSYGACIVGGQNSFYGGDFEGHAAAFWFQSGAQNNNTFGARFEANTLDAQYDSGSSSNRIDGDGNKYLDNSNFNSFVNPYRFNVKPSLFRINNFEDHELTSTLSAGLTGPVSIVQSWNQSNGTTSPIAWQQVVSGSSHSMALYEWDWANNANPHPLRMQFVPGSETDINSSGSGNIALNYNNSATGNLEFFGGGTSTLFSVTAAGLTGMKNATVSGQLKMVNQADVPVYPVIQAGLTAQQEGKITWWDYLGAILWQAGNDIYGNFTLSDTLNVTREIVAQNGDSTYSAAGAGIFHVNRGSGTGGQKFYNGANGLNVFFDPAGPARFYGGIYGGTGGTTQLFNAAGVLQVPAYSYTPSQVQTCTNKVLTAVDAAATAGNCASVSSAMVDSSIVTTAGGKTFTAANTVTGLPTGCVQYPCVVAHGAVGGFTAAVTNTNCPAGTVASGSSCLIFTTTEAGEYILSAAAMVTTVATGSATTVSVNLTWPSNALEGSTVASGAIQYLYAQGRVLKNTWLAASQNVTLMTSLSGAIGTGVYQVSWSVTRLQ